MAPDHPSGPGKRAVNWLWLITLIRIAHYYERFIQSCSLRRRTVPHGDTRSLACRRHNANVWGMLRYVAACLRRRNMPLSATRHRNATQRNAAHRIRRERAFNFVWYDQRRYTTSPLYHYAKPPPTPPDINALFLVTQIHEKFTWFALPRVGPEL